MADFADIIGFCATVVAALVSPAQLFILLRADKHHSRADSTHPAHTVSLISTVLVCVCNTLWCVYGVFHGATWSAVLGAVVITVQITALVVCITARVIQWWFLAYLGVLLGAVAYAGYLMPAALLGATAAGMAVLNYVPAAIKQYKAVCRVRRSSSGGSALNTSTAYPRGMGLIMLSANLLWIMYAVVIHDMWVGLPCAINAVTSVVFIVTHTVAVRSKAVRFKTVK